MGSIVRCLVLTIALSLWSQNIEAEPVVSNMRIAIEPKGEHFFVRQMVVLTPSSGKDESVSIHIPYPKGAQDVTLSNEHPSDGFTLEADGIAVQGSLPKDGRPVAFMYLLPKQSEMVVLEQDFGRPIPLVHVAFVGPLDGVRIDGKGFSPAVPREMAPGMPALFTVGQGFDDGRVRFAVSGFQKSLMPIAALVVTILSFGMLLLGLVFYLRMCK